MDTRMLKLNLLSISARVEYSELDTFDWYTFKGSRKVKLTARNHTNHVTPGEVYGIRPIRGDKFYVIFPDSYHIAYIVSERQANSLMEKSSKKRKMPVIEDARSGGRKRAAKVATGSKKLNRSSPRFKPLDKVPNEKTAGVDFENYQWRKLVDPKFVYNKTRSKGFELTKNEKFGLRFHKQARGGFIVMQDGQYWPLPTSVYDDLVARSEVLPLNRWLKGKLSAEEIESFQARKIANQKQRDADARAEERERSRALKEELKRKERMKNLAEREAKREAAQKALNKIPDAPKVFDDVKQIGAIDALKEQLKEDSPIIRDIDDMGVDDEDFDLQIDDDIDTLDNEVDDGDDEIMEDEVDVVDADQDAIDDALDAELDKAKDLARASQVIYEDDEDDNLGLDDLDEEDEDDEDYDDEDDDLTMEEENEEADIDAALDSADYDDDEEYEDDSEPEEPDEEEDEDSDSDEDVVDEDESDGEDESGDSEEETFEEGNVITFHKDESEKREWVILDIYPLKNNDAITVYKLYDVNADDGEYRTVRVKTGSKSTIEKMAKLVRKLNPKEFSKYFSAMDSYDKNPEPITS